MAARQVKFPVGSILGADHATERNRRMRARLDSRFTHGILETYKTDGKVTITTYGPFAPEGILGAVEYPQLVGLSHDAIYAITSFSDQVEVVSLFDRAVGRAGV